MKNKFIFLLSLLVITSFILPLNSYSGQYNTTFGSENYVRIIQNWKVALYENNGQEMVSMITHSNLSGIFTIGINKIGNNIGIGYSSTVPNIINLPSGSQNNTNGVLNINNKKYNISIMIVADGPAIGNFFQFPNNFLDLAKNSKYFTISYNGITERIDLSGFKQALEYAFYLVNNKIK